MDKPIFAVYYPKAYTFDNLVRYLEGMQTQLADKKYYNKLYNT